MCTHILRRIVPVVSLLLLASTPSDAQTLYTVVLGNQNHVVGSSTLESGLFVSYDEAKTWEQLGPRNLKAYSMDAVLEADGRILYIAAGNGVHRSLDSGASWKIVTQPEVTEVLDVVIDQSDPRYVYAGTAFGLWWSSDSGKQWQKSEGPLGDTYIYRLGFDRFHWNSGRTLLVMTDQRHRPTWGISSDSGAVRPAQTSEQNRVLFVHPDSVVHYQARYPDRVIQHDRTATWHDAYDMVQVDPGHRNLSSQTVYTDSTRVMMSVLPTNGFSPDYSGPFAQVGERLPSPVHALATLRRPWPHVLIAGTFGDGLWGYTEEKGWKQMGLEGAQVWRIKSFRY